MGERTSDGNVNLFNRVVPNMPVGYCSGDRLNTPLMAWSLLSGRTRVWRFILAGECISRMRFVLYRRTSLHRKAISSLIVIHSELLSKAPWGPSAISTVCSR